MFARLVMFIFIVSFVSCASQRSNNRSEHLHSDRPQIHFKSEAVKTNN